MKTPETIPTLTRDDLLAWPKAELHCHLDGSLRLSTLLDLAQQQGKTNLLPADNVEALEAFLQKIDDSETNPLGEWLFRPSVAFGTRGERFGWIP